MEIRENKEGRPHRLPKEFMWVCSFVISKGIFFASYSIQKEKEIALIYSRKQKCPTK
jgi:hypothetical protein